MKPALSLFSAAVLLAISASTGYARNTEEVGTSSDPLKVAPSNKPNKPQPRDACKQGYVWREARSSDHVCVDPRTRDEVAQQNRQAARLWVKGDYGPRTCRQGYVWREAFDGDQVCVVPEFRDRTRQDNARAAQRRVKG
jgi:hypothetical protein